MATFTNDFSHDYNARVLAQAQIGDVIIDIGHGETIPMEVVWIAQNRRSILTKAQTRNVFKHFEWFGFAHDAFIGPDWTIERIVG